MFRLLHFWSHGPLGDLFTGPIVGLWTSAFVYFKTVEYTSYFEVYLFFVFLVVGTLDFWMFCFVHVLISGCWDILLCVFSKFCLIGYLDI